MKAISAVLTRGLQPGSRVRCIDNTGAKELEVISFLRYKGVMRKRVKGGVADIAICSVKKGQQKMIHEVVRAVIVRQKKEYRRPSGMRIKFADNAAVLVDEKNEPRGKEIKGVIAKEVVERFSPIGKIASMVV